MKTIVRITILVLLLALALPIVPAGAQDGEEPFVSVEPTAVYFLQASSGSFTDNGDGTYTMALDGVGESIVWLMSQPTLSVATLNSASLNTQWASNEALVADAVLEVGDLNVALTLTSPALADGTQTFVATVGEIVSFGDAKEPELPMSFDAANLSISWTMDFQNGLVVGIQAMYEGVRATPEECAAAQTQWDAYQGWMSTNYNTMANAASACKAGDAAACTTFSGLASQYQGYSYIGQAASLVLNTGCQ